MYRDYTYVSEVLVKWYSSNKRILPWRDTKNPYQIWMSEIILQQTRVAQGYDYYIRFLKAFPDIEDLAKADEDIVMKLWQGLGYYSRARNLHETAKFICRECAGVFPNDYKGILSLKGVGEYTAAAIGSFAFDLPYAVVDGNVYRVLSRLFGIDTPIDSAEGKKNFKDLANELLDKKDPGLHNQAIMEFGALQCVPTSPDCEVCPLVNVCQAYAVDRVKEFPVKQGKTQVKERFFNYFDIRCLSSIYLNKRTGNDIWRNLYELPLIETDAKLSFEDIQNTSYFKDLFDGAGQVSFYPIPITFKHVLSHRIIFATFYRVEVSNDDLLRDKYLKTDFIELNNYPISRLVDKYFESIGDPNLFLA